MSSTSEHKQVVLGNEYDQALRKHLLDVLKEMGAKARDHSNLLAGSQELVRFEVTLEGRLIGIEAETYIGLTIAGETGLIDEVATRVRARMA